MIESFAKFRGSRPFWGGLFILVSGAVIAVLPLGPLWYYIHAGVGAIMGEVIGLGLLVVGACTWLFPAHRRSLGPLAVGLALIAFPLSNLGGLVIGTIAGILGGAMTFGWMPPDGGSTPEDVHDDPLASLLLPSEAQPEISPDAEPLHDAAPAVEPEPVPATAGVASSPPTIAQPTSAQPTSAQPTSAQPHDSTAH